MNCSKCNSLLPSDGSYLECHGCKSKIHFDCSGVSFLTWKAKSVAQKKDYRCVICRNTRKVNNANSSFTLSQSGNLDDCIDTTARDFIQRLFDQQKIFFESIIKSWELKVEQILVSINVFSEEIKEIKKSIKKHENEISVLTNDLRELQKNFHQLSQYSRNKNLEISGFPEVEKNNDDLKKNLKLLMDSLGVDVPEGEFVAHRLPIRNKLTKSKAKPIVIQFVNRTVRDKILENAKRMKPTAKLLDTTLLNDPIYVNAHLTPYYKHLFSEAKKIKIKKNYQFLWFSGSDLFIKKDSKSLKFKITDLSDLEKL